MSRRLAPLAAVSVAGLLVSGAAHAASKPGKFKIVKTTKIKGFDSLSVVVAPSRRSAFAFGYSRGDKDLVPLAYRWDGRRWQRSPLPKGLTGLTVDQASAVSANDVWASMPGSVPGVDPLGTYEPLLLEDDECYVDGERRAVRPNAVAASRLARAARAPKGTASRVLRWNGRKWTIAATFTKAVVYSVNAFGPRNVWVFGADAKGPAAWRFNGKKWTRKALALSLIDVKAASPRNMWAIGSDAKGEFLARFDGRRWRVTPTKLPANTTPTKGSAGIETVLNKVALAKGRPWVTAFTMTGKLCGDIESTDALLRWTGRAWVREKVPGVKRHVPMAHAASGDGTLHMITSDPTTDYGLRQFRRTAKGAWSSQPLAVDGFFYDLAAVSGSPSAMWGVGYTLSEPAEGSSLSGFIARKP